MSHKKGIFWILRYVGPKSDNIVAFHAQNVRNNIVIWMSAVFRHFSHRKPARLTDLCYTNEPMADISSDILTLTSTCGMSAGSPRWLARARRASRRGWGTSGFRGTPGRTRERQKLRRCCGRGTPLCEREFNPGNSYFQKYLATWIARE